MKPKYLFPCLLSVLCAACTSTSNNTTLPEAAHPNRIVTVTYVNPEKFTDVKDSMMDSEKTRDDLLGQLKEYIVERAAYRMTDGQTFAVTITDVDMAGDFEPWRGPRAQDVRIIKDLYPPRIDLSYTLTDTNGTVVSEGPAQLRDLSFMMSITPISMNDSLRYEKRLLDDWLSTVFSKTKK